MVPVRTCLGCRSRVDVSALMRVVLRGSEIVVDVSATFPGRGAWIHPAMGCAELAAKRRAFGRAFRVTTAPSASQVLTAVELLEGSSGKHHVGFHSGSPNEQAD